MKTCLVNEIVINILCRKKKKAKPKAKTSKSNN